VSASITHTPAHPCLLSCWRRSCRSRVSLSGWVSHVTTKKQSSWGWNPLWTRPSVRDSCSIESFPTFKIPMRRWRIVSGNNWHASKSSVAKFASVPWLNWSPMRAITLLFASWMGTTGVASAIVLPQSSVKKDSVTTERGKERREKHSIKSLKYNVHEDWQSSNVLGGNHTVFFSTKCTIHNNFSSPSSLGASSCESGNKRKRRRNLLPKQHEESTSEWLMWFRIQIFLSLPFDHTQSAQWVYTATHCSQVVNHSNTGTPLSTKRMKKKRLKKSKKRSVP